MSIKKIILALVVLSGGYLGLKTLDEGNVDILITNGLVYSGELESPNKATIAIKDSRIVYVGKATSKFKADKTIDATGLVITPGFIDPHTHAGAELFSDTDNANINYLTQGVTTVFIGNDGRGAVEIEATGKKLETAGIGTNVAQHVGFGTVRENVMGGEDRAPTAEELEAMKDLVDQAMEEGAFGLSTGLWYAPQNFSETEEVIELAKIAAKHNGVYSSHLRDESSFNKGLIDSVTETLRIARESGVAVHFTHIKALGVDVWGKSKDFIKLVKEAQAEGYTVTGDQYPWPASGTSVTNAIIPRWALAPNDQALLTRLDDPEIAPGLIAEIKENLRRRGGAYSILINDSALEGVEGKRISEIAKERGTPPLETAIDLVREAIKINRHSRVASFNMHPNDIQAFAKEPWVVGSSDGSTGHPRKFASFPKRYRDYVVDAQIMTMERFVNSVSAQTADIFGIKDRGRIKEGAFADIALLDLKNFQPKATFTNPTELSTGVKHLIINGVLALENGEYTGTMPGQAIKKTN